MEKQTAPEAPSVDLCTCPMSLREVGDHSVACPLHKPYDPMNDPDRPVDPDSELRSGDWSWPRDLER